jgi:2-polyprenyl-6-methoxyphenol hydroxylase-like FAD-dependent oxidoreductase
MASQTTEAGPDVTVIGGGLAGKAASLHLAKAGLKVICIEPEAGDRQAVGESLDWSAPELLKALGLPMDELVQTSVATWKRHVILKLPQGPPENYVPVPWLARSPFRVELRTLHVDRARLDAELRRRTLNSGVTFIQDKVARVERNGKRISAAVTSAGRRLSSPWFIDAPRFLLESSNFGRFSTALRKRRSGRTSRRPMQLKEQLCTCSPFRPSTSIGFGKSLSVLR